MRVLLVLVGACALAACSTAPAARGEARPMTPELASIVEFLLTSAATDFHAHSPPGPVRFREVRLGHLLTPSGTAELYRLCGQFLPAQEGGEAQWMAFATIQTSGYEQWLGPPGLSNCQGAALHWDDAGDLSVALQRRVEALR